MNGMQAKLYKQLELKQLDLRRSQEDFRMLAAIYTATADNLENRIWDLKEQMAKVQEGI